jgi:diguanylate cyclase
MAIPNMSGEQMRMTLKELEQAIYNHEQWSEMLHGTLICRLTPDQRDVSDDAHHNCRFGQWYDKSGVAALSSHAGFAELGSEHERMHKYAVNLLRLSAAGMPISIDDYERFVTALKRLRLEITTIQRELEDALYNLDPLTGASSRIGMLTKLREQQNLVMRGGYSCAVAMMDLDHFKSINDNFGHAAGDKVLVDVTRHITSHLRPYDRIFRYGGEEFLICLSNTDLETGQKIVERVRGELASMPHEAGGKGTFYVTVSSGLTLLDPDVSVEESVDRADSALYVAKSLGRNRVTIWDVSMQPSAVAVARSA